MRSGAARRLCTNYYIDSQTRKNIMDALLIDSKNVNPHVRDTCVCAIDSIKNFLSTSVSPSSSRNINILRGLLFNPEITVIKRKETILNLRNLATEEAAIILGSALAKTYMTIPIQLQILSSLQKFKNPIGSEELRKIVSNTNIIPSVRHEAIKFLVSIDRNCDKFLEELKSDERVLKDSIRIGLSRIFK